MKVITIKLVIFVFFSQGVLTGCHVNGKVFKEGASTEEVEQNPSDPNSPNPNNPSDPSNPGNGNGSTPDPTVGNILVNGSTVTTSSGHKVSIVVGDLEVLSVSGGYTAEPILVK